MNKNGKKWSNLKLMYVVIILFPPKVTFAKEFGQYSPPN